MIKSITAEGVIYNNPVIFECLPNKDGLFELSIKKRRGRSDSAEDFEDKHYADSLEQAWEMMKTGNYYLVLSGNLSGVHRKSLRGINSLDVCFLNEPAY
ncbi:hypothetical protein [Vibrio sp. 99-70-13A1]|uniref:hypothetical protein n=1 Tax=Vibrio sp. 99-70-13A1 TaxID=2607601 RepID=UPI00149369F5|nr:hypothetical protein [Vibrio sp. 99-70-13A1]NOH95663.1 hypothetical protein [Vibrio sp. 99-70-13A1]